jgi:hypothetical protein
MTRRKQNTSKPDTAQSGVFVSPPEKPIDITQPLIHAAYGLYHKNLWRVDDTLIVYDWQRGGWHRVPINSETGKLWARFMSHKYNYDEWTYRLKEYLNAHIEIQETVDRAEVEQYLSRYIGEQDSIKRAYLAIAQISAQELINQRFNGQDRLPKDEVRRIIEHQVNMCVDHYQQTLTFMERELST